MTMQAGTPAFLVEWKSKGYLSLCTSRLSNLVRNQVVGISTGKGEGLGRVAATGLTIVYCKDGIRVPEIARPVSWSELASTTPDLLSKVRNEVQHLGLTLRIEAAYSDPLSRYIVLISEDALSLTDEARAALSLALRCSLALLPKLPDPSEPARVPPDTCSALLGMSMATSAAHTTKDRFLSAILQRRIDAPVVKLMALLGSHVDTPQGRARLVQLSLLRGRAKLKLASEAELEIAIGELIRAHGKGVTT